MERIGDMKYIDLSHTFKDNMPGFRMKSEDGTVVQYSAKVRPFMTHQQSLPNYHGKAAFEITEISFQTSIGTYLDSPYHRYPEGRDISELRIEETILPGEVIDLRGKGEFEPVGIEVIPKGLDLKGKAILLNFGWDRYWGSEQYYAYPFILEELIQYLVSMEVKLVGVDTINIDNAKDPKRPAHSMFLKHEILIVENLTGLEHLYGKKFMFYAVPWKAEKTAAIPVRAFAETI
jgi:arylformamidase